MSEDAKNITKKNLVFIFKDLDSILALIKKGYGIDSDVYAKAASDVQKNKDRIRALIPHFSDKNSTEE